MNKYFILISLNIFLSNCSTTKSVLENYENQTIIYSNASNDDTKTIDFSFKSDDENLVCLGFLDNFKEDIVVYLNDKLVLKFHRNEFDSYKKLSHEEIFKFINLNDPDKENLITIGLVQPKKKMQFIINKDKRFFLISRFNETWFVTALDN